LKQIVSDFLLTGNCFSGRPRPDRRREAQGSGGRGFDFPQVSVGWDNNARFVDRRGAIEGNLNPETFKKYLAKAMDYVDEHPDQTNLITINAWNEWVEGSYLEPDERFGMAYLEAVKDVFVGR